MSKYLLHLLNRDGPERTLERRGTPPRKEDEIDIDNRMYTVIESSPAQGSGWEDDSFYRPAEVSAIQSEDHSRFIAQAYSMFD